MIEKIGDLIYQFMERAQWIKGPLFLIGWPRATTEYPRLEPIEVGKEKRILVFAPHQDDEVLGCGGTLAKHALIGSRISILYMTDGRNGNPRFPTEEIIKERKKEALDGLKILGVEDSIFMDYPDSNLKSDEDTVGRILSQIKEFRPDTIFTPFPLDNHPDHVCTTAIVASALKQYPECLDCYCYEVWSALPPNVIIDISDVVEKKKDAIRRHRSQIEVIDYTEKVIGLNAFRSLTAGNGIRYCEAFLKSSRKDFIKGVEGARTGR